MAPQKIGGSHPPCALVLHLLQLQRRPLSAGDLKALYDRRRACYERFADHVVDNNGTVEDTVRAILNMLQ